VKSLHAKASKEKTVKRQTFMLVVTTVALLCTGASFPTGNVSAQVIDFQTAGEFRIEALGDENHSVKYGYMLFRLRKTR
jgi:hypothetical protein